VTGRTDERGLPAVAVGDLSYAYANGEPVLHDLSLVVAAGQTVVLAGLSGCGKTTLCNCLTGLAPKALGGRLSGTIHICGADIAALPLCQVSSRIGLVFQDPDDQIVAATVEDEIAFAPENLAIDPAEIRRRVDRELARFGIAGLALRNPTTLSGGEKHLVAIAAVLALDPPVVVLDEPLAQLDQAGRLLVLGALLELRKERRTLIIVEHDLSLLDFADRYIVMLGGRIVSDSSDRPSAFVERPDPAVSAPRLRLAT
jgi:energy-coupling factor transport system ATP-binding protein